MATLNEMTSMMAIMAITLVEVILVAVVAKGVLGAMAMWALVGLFTALVEACMARGEDHGTGRGSCVHMCTLTSIHT